MQPVSDTMVHRAGCCCCDSAQCTHVSHLPCSQCLLARSTQSWVLLLGQCSMYACVPFAMQPVSDSTVHTELGAAAVTVLNARFTVTVYIGSRSTGRNNAAGICFSPGRPKFRHAENL